MTEETSTTICRPDTNYEDEDDGGLDEESSCCCCHCGAGQEDSKTKSYIKMREHLQQRLKAKSSGLTSGSSACDSSTGSRSSSSKSNIDGYADVDDLLDYIEGGKSKGKAVTQPNPKKAAKKARQKAKKLENAKAEELAAAKRLTEASAPPTQSRVPNGMVRITHNPLTNSAVITPLYGPLESSPSYLQQPLGFANPSQPATTRLLNPTPAPTPVIPPPVKLSQAPVQQPSSNATTSTPSSSSSSQPQQMVTIRRVMQPNLSEPVVTVTLKGDTPDYDRVLFTLVNGQVLPTNGEKPAANASVPSNQHQTPSTAPPPPPAPLSRKKLKKQEKRKQKLLLRNATSAPAPTPQPQSNYPAASVNCNNQDFTLDNFRLPPGITLTRVHQGSYPHSAHPELPVRMVDQRNNNKKGSVNSGTNTSQTGPNPIIVTNPPKAKESMGTLGGLAAPNVIVVDTRKIQAPQKPVQMCSVAVQTGWDEDDDVTLVDESQLSKKQRKKLRRERLQQQQEQEQVQAVLEVQMASLQLNSNNKKANKKNNAAVAPKAPTNNVKTSTSATTTPAPPTVNGTSTTKSKKKKKNNTASKQRQGSVGEDKWEENVFVPKSDLDLEGGDLDEDERELEAFKRFCFNTVPPERKEKVRIHLNVKDIFGKKTPNGLQQQQHNSSCKST